MSGEQGWRTETDAEVYFGNQRKQVAVADRRPVVRNGADIGMGPGIAAQAVPITDYNDLLATYNGYFSAPVGTFGAPNDTEAFVGITVNDATLGGFQLFTGLTTNVTYKRVFQRNPSDASSILWKTWEDTSGVLVGEVKIWPTNVAPVNHLILDGSSFSALAYPKLAVLLGGTVLPDLRDRTIYGVGSAWALASTDGLAAGTRTKNLFHEHLTLQLSNSGDHSHAIVEDGAHAHGGETGSSTLTTNDTTGGGGVQRAGPDTSHKHNIPSGGSHNHLGLVSFFGDHTHTGKTVDLADSGPLLRGVGMNYIIRAK